MFRMFGERETVEGSGGALREEGGTMGKKREGGGRVDNGEEERG